MKVTTESGAVYEFTKNRAKFHRLRKRNEIDPEAEVERVELRQDGQWLKLLSDVEPKLGYPMTLLVEPLDPPFIEGAVMTVRNTSVVIGIEE